MRVVDSLRAHPGPCWWQVRRSSTGSNHGFTLVEVMLVVTIFAILVAIGLAELNMAVRRHRVQASASMVVSKLTEARLNALKRNRTTWLLVDAAAGRVQVQTTGPGGTPMDLGEPGFLSDGVTFGAAPAQITFDAMGRSAVVQTVQVTSPERALTVTVRLTGAATIS